MPMKRRFMMFIVVVASACNRTQPSAPTWVPPIQLVTRQFSGVVLTDDGRPVPAATVWFLRSTTGTPYGTGHFDEVNATTDGSGFYQLAWDQPASWTGTRARVTQPLYEDTVAEVPYMAGQTEVTQNLRLYRSVT